MTDRSPVRLYGAGLNAYALSIFCSAFSIALTQSLLGVALVLFVVIAIRDRYQPFKSEFKWFHWAVAAYLVWLVVASIAAGSFLHSINNAREEWLFLAIPLVIYLLKEEKHVHLVAVFLAVGVMVMSSVSVFQGAVFLIKRFFGEVSPTVETYFRTAGTFAHSLTFGNYLAIATVFVLAYRICGPPFQYRWLNRLLVLAALFGLVGTILSTGRGPIVALVIGLVLTAVLARKKARWISLAIVFLVVAGALASPSVRHRFTVELSNNLEKKWPSGRLYVWAISSDIILDNPVTGVGPGNFDDEYRRRLPESFPSKLWYTHAHNDFLNVAAVSGLPGSVIFGLIWLAALYYLISGWRRSRENSSSRRELSASLAGAVVFLVASMTEATFVDEEVRGLLMFVWAVGFAAVYKQGQPKAERSPGDNALLTEPEKRV